MRLYVNVRRRMQPDLLCLSSFRHPGLSSPGLTGFTRADIERCKGLTRVDMERGSVTRAELERCKRDSGVLIEDTDTMSDDNSTITMLSNMHQHFSHLRLLPPLPFTTVLRSPLHSPRSQDGTSSPCPTHCSSERQLQCWQENMRQRSLLGWHVAGDTVLQNDNIALMIKMTGDTLAFKMMLHRWQR